MLQLSEQLGVFCFGYVQNITKLKYVFYDNNKFKVGLY